MGRFYLEGKINKNCSLLDMRVRELEVTVTSPEFLANIIGWTVGLLTERENSRKRGKKMNGKLMSSILDILISRCL